MSLEKTKPGASRAAAAMSEGRRAQSGQPPASAPNSGGVSVDSTSGHAVSQDWEVCGGGQTEPCAQAGVPGEAQGAAAEVGVLHSSADLLALDADYRAELRAAAVREGTCHHARKRSEGNGDGPRGIRTPDKLRKLQLALYRKAKAMTTMDSGAGLGLCSRPEAMRRRCSESRIREIRPSGSMRGGVEAGTGNCDRFNPASAPPTLLGRGVSLCLCFEKNCVSRVTRFQFP